MICSRRPSFAKSIKDLTYQGHALKENILDENSVKNSYRQQDEMRGSDLNMLYLKIKFG